MNLNCTVKKRTLNSCKFLLLQEKSLDGMNWLQLHWEHMAFVPLENLLTLRGIVLDSLALNSELLKVSCDVNILLRAHVGLLKCLHTQAP